LSHSDSFHTLSGPLVFPLDLLLQIDLQHDRALTFTASNVIIATARMEGLHTDAEGNSEGAERRGGTGGERKVETRLCIEAIEY
jgi:hypothetical protein